MNAPAPNRTILRMHVASVEARHPLVFVGLLPRGSAAHVRSDDALDFLAEARPSIDLFALARAELDLADLLGRPVGIVVTGALRPAEAETFRAQAEPV